MAIYRDNVTTTRPVYTERELLMGDRWPTSYLLKAAALAISAVLLFMLAIWGITQNQTYGQYPMMLDYAGTSPVVTPLPTNSVTPMPGETNLNQGADENAGPTGLGAGTGTTGTGTTSGSSTPGTTGATGPDAAGTATPGTNVNTPGQDAGVPATEPMDADPSVPGVQ